MNTTFGKIPSHKSKLELCIEHNYATPTGVQKKNKCFKCGKSYVYAFNLMKHTSKCMKKAGVLCRMCGEKFENYRDLYVHRMMNHSIYVSSLLQKEPWEHDNEAPWPQLEGDQGHNMWEVYNIHQVNML